MGWNGSRKLGRDTRELSGVTRIFQILMVMWVTLLSQNSLN